MFEEDKKYMKFSDIKLKQPLSDVKRTDKIDNHDTLVIPENFLNTIARFFEAANIEYQTIENPKFYPQDKLKAGLQRFEDENEYFAYEDPVLFVTQYDADALFEWAKQLYGETMDASYRKYLDDRHRQGEEYYEQNIRQFEE